MTSNGIDSNPDYKMDQVRVWIFCVIFLYNFLPLLTFLVCYQLSLNRVAERDADSDTESECHVVAMQPGRYLENIQNEKGLVKMMNNINYFKPNLLHIFNSRKAEKFSDEVTEGEQ